MKKLLLTILILLPLTVTALPTQPKTMLVWTPPTLNTDGTALTDLAGFIMYCGSSSGSYTITYDMPVPTQDSETFVNMGLPDGINYCTVTSYDTTGNESGYSNEVNFTLLGGLTVLVGVPAAPSNFKVTY